MSDDARPRLIIASHNPGKIRDIQSLLAQYAGKETQLLQEVKQKYRVRTAAERRSQEAAARKIVRDKETAVLADRFLSEVSQREQAAADREVVVRSLFVASRPVSRGSGRQDDLDFTAAGVDDAVAATLAAAVAAAVALLKLLRSLLHLLL